MVTNAKALLTFLKFRIKCMRDFPPLLHFPSLSIDHKQRHMHNVLAMLLVPYIIAHTSM